MLPKVIHYCWFGGNPLPEAYKRYIESWKKYCPGYEIVEWNENNFDVNACEYTKQAYATKHWAFVSDYARLKILYEQGGLYFDTDVEMIKPLDDIVAAGGFVGTEWGFSAMVVNLGLGMGAEAGDPLIREMLDYYEHTPFIVDGKPNVRDNIVVIVSRILTGHGFNSKNHIVQSIQSIKVYPPEFFGPKDFFTEECKITENTRTVHHYGYSWGSDDAKHMHEMRKKYVRLFGRKYGLKIWYILSIPSMFKNTIREIGWRKAVYRLLKRIGVKN